MMLYSYMFESLLRVLSCFAISFLGRGQVEIELVRIAVWSGTGRVVPVEVQVRVHRQAEL
jgi:hypothetical protein